MKSNNMKDRTGKLVQYVTLMYQYCAVFENLQIRKVV